MKRPYEDISINQCAESKNVFVNVVAENTGSIIVIPVYLYNVCPCRKMVVGVTLIVNGKPYATKAKKIFTGGHRCCFFARSIGRIYAGDFEFLLTDNCNDVITYCTSSHYIF